MVDGSPTSVADTHTQAHAVQRRSNQCTQKRQRGQRNGPPWQLPCSIKRQCHESWLPLLGAHCTAPSVFAPGKGGQHHIKAASYGIVTVFLPLAGDSYDSSGSARISSEISPVCPDR